MTALLTLAVVLAAATWAVTRPGDASADLPTLPGGGDSSLLVGAADGSLPDEGISPSETTQVGLARMDPDLLAAVQEAAAAAAADGVELRVTSGWRSASYQQQLLDDAIDSYGEREARKVVQTPDRSRHVSGEAVDIGPTDAAFWVLRHGSDFGLCQVYANEMWHYELLTSPGGECPPLQDDAS